MVKIAATVERAPPLSLWPGKTPPGGWGEAFPHTPGSVREARAELVRALLGTRRRQRAGDSL